MSHDLRADLDGGPMHRSQWVAVAVCVLLNMLDGFDVLVMAFTGESVSTEFGLNGGQLGLLLSAGLVGMAAGSLLLAPFADRFGRRPLILVSLGIASLGMLLASVSGSAIELGLLRVLTGLGIGGILACSNTIAAEYASRRWRGLAVSLNSTGYALGATLGGVLAVVLIGEFGWRSVFLFGGVATLFAIPLVLVGMPESLDFLLSRRPNRALDKINRVARRFGRAPLEELPPVSTGPGRTGVAAGFRTLLGPRLRRGTLILWTAFFLVMAGFYFVTSWTPTLLVEAGLSATQGLTGGTLLNLGGIFGATALGVLAARWSLRNVLVVYLVTTAAMLALFLLALGSLAAAFAGGALIGLFVNGCVAGLYALTPNVYDGGVRATGVGTAIGIGRIGAILSPTIAGTLLDAGWTPHHLYLAFGAVFVLTAAALTLLRGERTGTPAAASSPAGASSTAG
ncbi:MULTISPECIES: MFS transporter [Prauserella salsuginis group]|uniref:MFS transporter n=1 Tax=Prauserella salsuginis TaxID=387889 RepID=A0ABW6G9E5_9PSEU|nr:MULTISPECIES: MFS transporter [Prauserella salsuginis group]MCR3721548.1 benzoate transport [Prauserella flava]MCR3734240.1 benzoate transport [Prauserella salsuginis]